jgi:hypothetical protein
MPRARHYAYNVMATFSCKTFIHNLVMQGANDGEFIKRINHNLKQELANNHASVK